MLHLVWSYHRCMVTRPSLYAGTLFSKPALSRKLLTLHRSPHRPCFVRPGIDGCFNWVLIFGQTRNVAGNTSRSSITPCSFLATLNVSGQTEILRIWLFSFYKKFRFQIFKYASIGSSRLLFILLRSWTLKFNSMSFLSLVLPNSTVSLIWVLKYSRLHLFSAIPYSTLTKLIWVTECQ